MLPVQCVSSNVWATRSHFRVVLHPKYRLLVLLLCAHLWVVLQFVWAIIFILFFLDLLFAVVQFLQFKQARFFRGFARAEFAYIILSLTSKQLLAWIEFGGTQSLKQ